MLQRDINPAVRVIFVCYGNACRSPMAEMLCNSYGNGEIIAESAGVHPLLPYIDVNEPTIAVMKEIGIDISRHQPRHIRSVNLSPFGLLINMSPLAPRDFLRDSRSFNGKIIEWDVVDPRGGPPRVYREVRDDLKEKVLDLIKNLVAKS